SGAAIGAGVALLLAPQSGRQAQDQLRGYARRAQDGLHEFVEQASDAISRTVEKGQEVVQAKSSVVTEAIGAAGDRLREERERMVGPKKL
ncbi:MAG: YtxH domain-containing protein, partial [Nitrospira sp.]